MFSEPADDDENVQNAQKRQNRRSIAIVPKALKGQRRKIVPSTGTLDVFAFWTLLGCSLTVLNASKKKSCLSKPTVSTLVRSSRQKVASTMGCTARAVGRDWSLVAFVNPVHYANHEHSASCRS